MNRQVLIANTIDKIRQLPDIKIKEINNEENLYTAEDLKERYK